MFDSKFAETFDANFSGLDSLELVIQKLKNSGATMAICTQTLKSKLHISLSEADEIVVNSKAWEKNQQTTMDIRDAFLDALEELE